MSRLKAGVNITTGQYMNYQTITKLQLRRLVEKTFHSVHIDLRDISGEKIPFVSVGIPRFVSMFRKACNFHFSPKRRYKMVASRQIEVSFYKILVGNLKKDSVHSQKLSGQLQLHLCVNMWSQLQNVWVFKCWTLLS